MSEPSKLPETFLMLPQEHTDPYRKMGDDGTILGLCGMPPSRPSRLFHIIRSLNPNVTEKTTVFSVTLCSEAKPPSPFQEVAA